MSAGVATFACNLGFTFWSMSQWVPIAQLSLVAWALLTLSSK